MTTGDQIKYLQHKEIDKAKWDACITNSPNGLIYGYSFYLDCMARHWDALVLGDYEAVMPLTWNKKYGFYYIYQPFLSASLGVFGNHLNGDILESFLLAIPRRFRLWEFSLNHGNLFSVKGFDLHERVNFILPLHKRYEQLFEGFREN